MKAMWSGFISFGLINIPVKLFTGIEDHTPKFDLFHGPDLSPIRYARICRHEGKEVPWDEIVKGYEYAEENYVILDEEDFKNARGSFEKMIEILNFVDETEIDSVYFEKPYYLEPGKGGSKPYTLLLEAIKKSKKVGICRFVLHNKEHYGIVKTFEDILIVNQIRIAEDLRETSRLAISEFKVSKQEIDMAIMLIEQLAGPFEPEKYHDAYADRLMEIIKQKAKGKKVRMAKEKPVEGTKVVDIMGMLKKSLEGEKNHRRKRKTA